MKPLTTLTAGVLAATALAGAATAAAAHCGCPPRHVHHVAYRHPVRHLAAQRVVYVPVPGPERVVREPVYVPGPERIVREPVYVPGPTRVVREPVFAPPPIVVGERGWGPPRRFYPLAQPVRYGYGRGFEHDGWREHARFDGDRRYGGDGRWR